ncbi:hypothetical protein SGPA1_11925 [Streptomyces misionensis JCM 4497]
MSWRTFWSPVTEPTSGGCWRPTRAPNAPAAISKEWSPPHGCRTLPARATSDGPAVDGRRPRPVRVTAPSDRSRRRVRVGGRARLCTGSVPTGTGGGGCRSQPLAWRDALTIGMGDGRIAWPGTSNAATRPGSVTSPRAPICT